MRSIGTTLGLAVAAGGIMLPATGPAYHVRVRPPASCRRGDCGR